MGELNLTSFEAHVLGQAILGYIQDIKIAAADPEQPWNPETRKDLQRMISAGESVKKKLRLAGIPIGELAPVNPEDRDMFYTKES